MDRHHLLKGIIILTIIMFTASSLWAVEQPDTALKTLVKGNNIFAVDLYGELNKNEGNLFFSPYSISSALAMTYAGARRKTAKEMASTLHFNMKSVKTHVAFSQLSESLAEVQQKGDVQLDIANSLWPQKGYSLLSDYRELMKDYYRVSLTPLNYKNALEKAGDTINTWVKNKTNNKIKNIISKKVLSHKTLLVLVNAIYFKGRWASMFKPEKTYNTDFTLPSGRKKQVPMMHQESRFEYADHDTFKLLKLPYRGKDVSMMVLLPKKGDQLSQLESRLSVENIDSWLSELSIKDVNVALPKFEITWGVFDIIDALNALGMRKPFTGHADFSGMTGTKELFINNVFHKAFVQVNEKGTEAAAVTGVGMVSGYQAEPRVHTFKADHPFLFVIRDNTTGSILFMGRLVEPCAGEMGGNE